MIRTVRLELSRIDGRRLLEDNLAPENRLDRAMPLASFRGLIEMNRDWREVHLQGNGEPMLVPNLVEMIRYAKARRVDLVTLRSNATLLYRDRAEELVGAGLDELHVVIDGRRTYGDAVPARYPRDHFGSPWLENLAGLVGARTALGATWPRVKVAYRLDRRTVDALADTVWLLGSIGVIDVATIAAGPLAQIEARRAMRKAGAAADEWGIQLDRVGDWPSMGPYLTFEGLWRYPTEELRRQGNSLDLCGVVRGRGDQNGDYREAAAGLAAGR